MADKADVRFSINVYGSRGSLFNSTASSWEWIDEAKTVLQVVDEEGRIIIVRPGCMALVIREGVERQLS
jgi:hypothetical protein